MPIVKYCNFEHNPRRSPRVLIGNLEKYRSIENIELQDSEEGTITFNIDIVDSELSNDFAVELFPGLLSLNSSHSEVRNFGNLSFYVETVEFGKFGLNSAFCRRAKGRVVFRTINPWVFCASICDDTALSLSNNPFESYNDCWTVGENEDEIDLFSKRLVAGIRDSFYPKRHLAVASRKYLKHKSELEFEVRHGPVKYQSRDLLISNETAEGANALLNQYLDVIFFKPVTYQTDREYRFVVFPKIDGTIRSVKNKDIFVRSHLLSRPPSP